MKWGLKGDSFKMGQINYKVQEKVCIWNMYTFIYRYICKTYLNHNVYSKDNQEPTASQAFPNKATNCLSFGQSNNLLALLLLCQTPPLAPVSGKLFITFGLVLSNSNQHELK